MKTNKNKILFIFPVLVVPFLAGCDAPPATDWTVMMYVSGNNLEEENGEASFNLDEIADNVKTNSKVNLVIQLGGTTKWQSAKNGLVHEDGKTETYLYSNPEGKEHGEYKLIESKDYGLTGNPDNLSDFIKKTRKNYPAKKYGLWIWGHGSNALGGMLGDTNYNDRYGMQLMNYNSFEYAIKNGGVKFEHINFDCCSLANIELLSHLQGYANYVTFSENPTPGPGQAYDKFFPYLYEHSEINGKEYGAQLVNLFDQRYETEPDLHNNLSLVTADVNKTSGLIKTFNDFYYSFASELYNPNNYFDIKSIPTLDGVYQFDDFHTDIKQYIVKAKELDFSNQYMDQLINKVNETITSKFIGSELGDCGGLTHCNWTDAYYIVNGSDYDIYASRAEKLYGYIAFLDLFNQGWTAPYQIYQRNNIQRYADLPYKDFNIRLEYMNSPRNIDGVKVVHGEEVLREILFYGTFNSKEIVKDEEGEKIVDFRYRATNNDISSVDMFDLVKDGNNFYPKKDDFNWMIFNPYYNHEKEEYQAIRYPLPLENLSNKITNLEENKEVYIACDFDFQIDRASFDVFVPVVINDNGTMKVEKFLYRKDLSELGDSFTWEQLNSKLKDFSELTGRNVSFYVKGIDDTNVHFLKIFEQFDGSKANIEKLFTQDSMKSYFRYGYAAEDFFNKQATVPVISPK